MTAFGDGDCGESYDHDLRLVSFVEGSRCWECRECGAEICEDEEDMTDGEE